LWVTRSAAADITASTPPAARSGWLVRLLILGLLGGVLFGIGMNVSILLTGAAITAFIAGAYPVLTAAVAPFVLREPLRLGALAGLVLAFVGVLLIAGFDVAGVRLDGIAVAGLTALAVAAFMLLSRKWQRPWGIRPTQISLTNHGLLGLSGVLLALAQGDPLLTPQADLGAWLAVLWLGVAAGAIATILLAESHRRLPASEGSAYLMLNPLTAAVLAVPILGETFSAIQWAGAGLVLVGIGLATGTFAMLRRVLFTRRREGGYSEMPSSETLKSG
jgi:probable blue pigment (indigoidine) exporter